MRQAGTGEWGKYAQGNASCGSGWRRDGGTSRTPETGSWHQGETSRTQTIVAGRSTARGCHHTPARVNGQSDVSRQPTGATVQAKSESCAAGAHTGCVRSEKNNKRDTGACLDGCLQLQQYWLGHEHLPALDAQPTDFCLGLHKKTRGTVFFESRLG
jgi:hypothetical protein